MIHSGVGVTDNISPLACGRILREAAKCLSFRPRSSLFLVLTCAIRALMRLAFWTHAGGRRKTRQLVQWGAGGYDSTTRAALFETRNSDCLVASRRAREKDG
jgi:hypothetical protein